MRFDTITYRKKNKLLLFVVALLLLLAWFFAFSKTYRQIMDYQAMAALEDNVEKNPMHDMDYRLVKSAKMDSLMALYSVDSSTFEANFLPQISLVLQDIPVQITYENGTVQGTHPGSSVLRKEISVQGKYQDIIRAVKNLSQLYYIERFVMSEGDKAIISFTVFNNR